MVKKLRKENIILIVMGLVLTALFLFSFILGHYDVPVIQVVKILLSKIFPIQKTWTSIMEVAVINIRLPRILLACLVGCCLATAGTAYQSVFQNPMAAPDILGASSGACFGAAFAILMNMSKMGIVITAFICSLFTVFLVYIVGTKIRGSKTVNILLAGVMISSLFSAGTSYIKLVADPSNQLPAITYWLMGSLSGTRLSDVKFAVVPMLIGLIPLFLIRWRINILNVGEDEAKTLGVNTNLLRLTVIVSSTFITAAAVACSGMIGWVGLVIPHLCRKLVGNDCTYLIPSSMIFGSVFMLLVDNISRNLLQTEIPIGILTAFIGAPFFIYLMLEKEKR